MTTGEPTTTHGDHGLPIQRAVFWGLVGSVGYGLCQWATLVVIARLGTPEWVGRFSYGLAVSAPVIMLTNMQLGWLQATDGAERYRFADYWRHRLFYSLLGFLLIAAIAAWRADGPIAGIVLIVGAAKVFESWSDVHHGRFQRMQRLDLLASSQLMRGVGGVVAVALLIAATNALWPAIVGLALVWFSVWYFHDRKAGGKESTGSSAARVTALTRQAYPLGVAAMLVSINVSIPRLIIERVAGAHTLGVFAAIAYLVVGGRMVALPFGQVYAPRFGAALAAGDRVGFRRLLRHLLLVGLGLGAIGLIAAVGFGAPLLRVLYGPQYALEHRAFVIVMAVAAIGYLSSFLQLGVTAAREIGAQVPIIVLSILATGVCAWWLVPGNPIEGGALAMAAGAGVEFLGSVLLLWRTERRALDGQRTADPRPLAARDVGPGDGS
ncbi:MAG: lipopolysaccharide biosynthesis protein [Gemmatimonadales bacterium]